MGGHVTIEASDEAAARRQVEEIAERLLSNPVIENFHVLTVEEV